MFDIYFCSSVNHAEGQAQARESIIINKTQIHILVLYSTLVTNKIYPHIFISMYKYFVH